MKYLIPVILLFLILPGLQAQELNATVRVTVPKLQTADPKVFETMEQDIKEFFNNTQWTEFYFEPFERIECSFQINILEELSSSAFKADIAMQAVRPVYGSDYKTATISHVDRDIIITYEQFQPIVDSRNTFRDNLSSLLTFYSYLILGYDGDTFELMGGAPFFQICQNIVNNVPPQVSGSDKGWTSQSNKNSRYWVLENALSPKLRTYREAMYKYHREGLDVMASDVTTGTTEMLTAILALDGARNQYPNSTALQMFANAKSDEIIEIFKVADNQSKNKVMQVMRRIDVAHANKYDVLKS